MFACMPFVNIKVVNVKESSEVICGYIQIMDIPWVINQWVNTSNLSAIQNQALIQVPDYHYSRIIAYVKEYLDECNENKRNDNEDICNLIQRDIIALRSKLIVAQVLKVYFDNIPMQVSGHAHRDIVFQQFILSLYGNFRQHRDVRFYASHSGVSLKYFSTIIRQITGTSPSEWIEAVVVGEAKSMLSNPHRSIKEIAASLNFPDTSTFTKYFARITGMSPRAFRRSDTN